MVTMAAARVHPAASIARTPFADTRHLAFYGQQVSAAPRRAALRPQAFKSANEAACTSSTGHRARVLRHIESVEETLKRLEQVGDRHAPRPAYAASCCLGAGVSRWSLGNLLTAFPFFIPAGGSHGLYALSGAPLVHHL